jgi:exosome complex component RRP42
MEAIDSIKSNYIRELLNNGAREDSRGPYDFRSIMIKTGVIEHAEGSAQVDLGATKVLAGVKLADGAPMADTPDQGTISMSAELLPLASADYEMGPPSPQSIELARVVDRGIRAGNCVALEDLILGEGKCWNVFVDIYILNYDGNLFDASELAAMAALMTTKVPKYEDEKVIREERVKDIKLNNIVTSSTFAKIGGHLVLDMNRNEENAADARLTIASDGNVVRAMQKGLNGGITVNEIDEMLDVAFKKHGELKSHLEKATNRSL